MYTYTVKASITSDDIILQFSVELCRYNPALYAREMLVPFAYNSLLSYVGAGVASLYPVRKLDLTILC